MLMKFYDKIYNHILIKNTYSSQFLCDTAVDPWENIVNSSDTKL